MGILSQQEDEIDKLKRRIDELEYERKMYKRAAIQWMRELDKHMAEYGCECNGDDDD